MTPKHKSLLYAILIGSLVTFVSKCSQGQSTQKSIENGYICFTRDWIFIRDKSDTVDYDLFIIETDSVRAKVIYSVAYFNGIAGFWIDSSSAYLQIKIEGMRRSRTKRYNFLR